MAKNGHSKAAAPPRLLAGQNQGIPISEVPFINPNNVQSVYSNSVSIMNGQFDIRLLFSEIVSEGIGKPVESILRANIAMTPAHAKALIGALTNAIEEYPKAFGEIPWPPKNQD